MNAVPFGMIEEFEAFEPMLIGVMIVFLVVYLLLLVASVTMYVLQSLGAYTVAKRRGIHHPWLAWLPIGNAWIWGSISDQYQYVVKGKVRNRRKVLLGLNIALFAMIIPMIGTEVAAIIAMEEAAAFGLVPMVLFVIVWLAFIVLAIVTTVFMYMAQYDFYRSCDPNNAVVYLVLGIFFEFLQAIFMFVCRKKDQGMPPRRQPQTQPAVAELPREVPAAEPAVSEESEEEVAVQAAAETTSEAAAEEPAEEPTQISEDPCVAEEADFAEKPTETE